MTREEIKDVKRELSVIRGCLVFLKEEIEESKRQSPEPLPIVKLEPPMEKMEGGKGDQIGYVETPPDSGQSSEGEVISGKGEESGIKGETSLEMVELLDGFGKLLRGEYSEASRIFSDYIRSGSDQEMIEEAMYYLAVSYFLRAEYEIAIVHFNRLEKRFPNGKRYFDSLLQKARCLIQIGQIGDAERVLTLILKNCPTLEIKKMAEKELKGLRRIPQKVKESGEK